MSAADHNAPSSPGLSVERLAEIERRAVVARNGGWINEADALDELLAEVKRLRADNERLNRDIDIELGLTSPARCEPTRD